MVIRLFGQPFSSYTWKPAFKCYESDTPFDFRIVDPAHSENGAELARRSAMGKFPLLLQGDASVFEATAIIEFLEAVYPGRLGNAFARRVVGEFAGEIRWQAERVLGAHRVAAAQLAAGCKV